jgi:hypothetical protein
MRHAALLAALVALPVRDCNVAGPGANQVIKGTWGGDNAGLIADDSTAHVHIACTYGNLHRPVVTDEFGRFDLPGEYVLRAYPVAVGPPLPARFAGLVVGRTLTLTVVVDDTTTGDTVRLGPARLRLGQEPQMQMCPICRSPRGR